jgi:hypothetical protein
LVNPTSKVGNAGGGARLMAVIFRRFGRQVDHSVDVFADNDRLPLGQKLAVLTALSALAWACIIAVAALL